MINEAFINKLILHMAEFKYWTGCHIYYGDKCWCDYDLSCFDESVTLLEETETAYVFSTNDHYDNLEITLYERMGGLLYADCDEPRLYKLSPDARDYMADYMKDHMGIDDICEDDTADGYVALNALEEFLFDNGCIIVDWNCAEGEDVITISEITLEAIKKRDRGFVSFERGLARWIENN